MAVKTTLVNMKTCKDSDIVRIDRSSPFGNPFRIGKDGDRKECIDKYRIAFNLLIKKSESFKQQVLNLKGKKLGCWCKPSPCHGDVIIEFLERS